MIEPRVASVSVAIDRHGITTVSVTRVLAGAGRERTVVYSGSDMSLAKEAVMAWTAKVERSDVHERGATAN
jgi:hypothetical protein